MEIFIRTVPELEQILEINPFKKRADEGTMQYITFLSGAPEKENILSLLAFNNETDTFDVIGKELYAHVVKNGSKSRYEPKFIEKKLDVLGTTRNINTVNKMLALANK